MEHTKFVNWSLVTDTNDICWLTIDRKNASANTLGREVMEELDAILEKLAMQAPKALIIKSGKPNGFIAGADITEFLHMESEEVAKAAVTKAQDIFAKLSALPYPTVAMINGFCLGGGLELSLACKYRVALDSPQTKIGLPEVNLGIQPGWGGSVRLPRLIGSISALNLILPGKIVDGRTAHKLGIVDACEPERYFLKAAEYYALNDPGCKNSGKLEKFLQLSFIRSLVGKYLTWQVAKKVNRSHYPAPFAVIENWVNNSIYSDKAFEAEATSIARLIATPTAQNLVRIFFLRERLKGFAKTSKFDLKRIHVIGAGVMGGDIAAWCALRGFRVTVQDKNLNAISATLQRAMQLFKKRLKVPFLIQDACDRLLPDVEGLGLTKADVIVEAIIENAQAKQEVFKNMEACAKPHAILATNTSTIPLDVIGKDMQRGQRVVGIHFFNPVALMQLVEVVSDKHTDRTVIDDAMAFVGKIDKLPLPVKSVPGFLVNRVLLPYLLESALIYAEGVPGPVIDKAATNFGMLMGPIELMDTVGLDICVAAAKGMNIELPPMVDEMIKEGKLGKKTGKGFYSYGKDGKPSKPKVNVGSYPDDIGDRIILRLVNEAANSVRVGVVSDADLADAGLVFGAGFAPFRGGPMKYAHDEGKANIKARLEALEMRYGERFAPDAYWSS